ncbi:MAG TPA: tectonin domain-containing protein, partial [Pyrinomonadaceae bacterium]
MRVFRGLLALRFPLASLALAIASIGEAITPVQERAPRPDGGIFRWDGQGWSQVAGAGYRISVGPDGAPWIVNSEGIIYRWDNDTFQAVAGRAKDIGVGANGTVWKIGWDNSIQRWNGQGWDSAPGSAETISVQSNGAPWIVNGAGQIYHWNADHFENLPGLARDIGAEKSIWVIDQDGLVYNWNHGDWVNDAGSGISTAGNAKRIAIGPDGSPWVVNNAREIYHWSDGTFQKFPGSATDIGVGADGSIWIVGAPNTAPPRGLGSGIGSIMGGGGARSNPGPIRGTPTRSDAGPVLGGTSDSNQGFKYSPSVIPSPDFVIFKFVTKESTIPRIEISRKPPRPDGGFDTVVASASPEEAGKQTRHEVRVENLRPGTHYYYIINITDERGRV